MPWASATARQRAPRKALTPGAAAASTAAASDNKLTAAAPHTGASAIVPSKKRRRMRINAPITVCGPSSVDVWAALLQRQRRRHVVHNHPAPRLALEDVDRRQPALPSAALHDSTRRHAPAHALAGLHHLHARDVAWPRRHRRRLSASLPRAPIVSLACTTTSCRRTLNFEPLLNTSFQEASTEERPWMQAEPG